MSHTIFSRRQTARIYLHRMCAKRKNARFDERFLWRAVLFHTDFNRTVENFHTTFIIGRTRNHTNGEGSAGCLTTFRLHDSLVSAAGARSPLSVLSFSNIS